MKTAVGVLSFIVGAFYLYLFFFDKPAIGRAFSCGSYYLILALFLFWVATLAKALIHYRPDLKSFVRAYGKGILFCFLMCGVVFFSVKPQFRVLADETNLLGISRSMTYEHRVDNMTMGKWYFYNFNPLRREMDKRPLLFPFLTHLVNTMTGVRPENGFVVNFILLMGLLTVIFILAQKTWGALWGYSAVFLVLANPVVTQGATSSGMELCAVFFTVVSLASLYYFLKAPDVLRFQLLWANLLMLANVRYETPLFLLLIVPLLLMLRYVPLSYWKQAWIFPLTPVLLLPLIWQKMIHAGMSNLFQTEANVKAFSFAHLFNNTKDFFAAALKYDYYLPYAGPIFVLGMALLLYFSMKSLRGQFEKYQRHFFLISMLTIVASWIVITAYHMGSLVHPCASRFFILYYVVLSLAALCLLRGFFFARQDVSLAFFISVLLFLLYHPVSIESRFCNSQILPRQYRMVVDFLKTQNNRNLLIITERPGMYTVRDYGAVDFQYANGNRANITMEFNRHLYQNIFVVQEVLYDGQRISAETVLDPQYKLSTVFELQNTANSFVRISRVDSIQL